mmetsp:Transcript_24280/g.67518  ORF Transcript_24280/g.67518 Transcript_24280/m.67518 type:complete len:340 (+) Transcript_24280:129-1148(+)
MGHHCHGWQGTACIAACRYSCWGAECQAGDTASTSARRPGNQLSGPAGSAASPGVRHPPESSGLPDDRDGRGTPSSLLTGSRPAGGEGVDCGRRLLPCWVVISISRSHTTSGSSRATALAVRMACCSSCFPPSLLGGTVSHWEVARATGMVHSRRAARPVGFEHRRATSRSTAQRSLEAPCSVTSPTEASPAPEPPTAALLNSRLCPGLWPVSRILSRIGHASVCRRRATNCPPESSTTSGRISRAASTAGWRWSFRADSRGAQRRWTAGSSVGVSGLGACSFSRSSCPSTASKTSSSALRARLLLWRARRHTTPTSSARRVVRISEEATSGAATSATD